MKTLLLALAAAAQLLPADALPRKADRPREAIAGLETDYGTLRTSDGLKLRTLVSRPAGGNGARLPAIFAAKWVACGSIEFRAERPSELKALALESGLAMIRVERAGEGDSEGECARLDFETEVRHYREALARLRHHRWIDPARIIVYGSSLGAMTAPLIADGNGVAGVLVQGGGGLSYFERMIGFDRLQLDRSGRFPLGAAAREMPRRIAFHQLYLLGRRTPAEIARDRPDLAGVWESLHGTAPDSHYGRPFAWHWQAAEQDVLPVWARLAVPVMVVWGEYDGFEPRYGHRLIVDTVNRHHPGSARWLELPATGHDLDVYTGPEAAWRFEGGRYQPEAFLRPVIAWLRAVAARPAQPPSSGSGSGSGSGASGSIHSG